MSLGKFISILVGAVLAIVGLGGVPLAIKAGSVNQLILFTLCLFVGIGILGWAYKE